MTITTVCTACGARQPLEAGFVGDDAKLLADVCAMMDPVIARPALGYLRLFKPRATELRLSRAVKLLRELHALVKAGRVSADDRSALERPATPAMWAAGIEQMQACPPGGIPLSNHNYLRKVVFDLANRSDAVAERQTEKELRAPRPQRPVTVSEPQPHDAVQVHIDWLAQQLKFKQITPEEHAAEVAKARGLTS